jgi:hypothetical protein
VKNASEIEIFVSVGRWEAFKKNNEDSNYHWLELLYRLKFVISLAQFWVIPRISHCFNPLKL